MIMDLEFEKKKKWKFTSSVQLCNLVDGSVNVSAWFQTG